MTAFCFAQKSCSWITLCTNCFSSKLLFTLTLIFVYSRLILLPRKLLFIIILVHNLVLLLLTTFTQLCLNNQSSNSSHLSYFNCSWICLVHCVQFCFDYTFFTHPCCSRITCTAPVCCRTRSMDNQTALQCFISAPLTPLLIRAPTKGNRTRLYSTSPGNGESNMHTLVITLGCFHWPAKPRLSFTTSSWVCVIVKH